MVIYNSFAKTWTRPTSWVYHFLITFCVFPSDSSCSGFCILSYLMVIYISFTDFWTIRNSPKVQKSPKKVQKSQKVTKSRKRMPKWRLGTFLGAKSSTCDLFGTQVIILVSICDFLRLLTIFLQEYFIKTVHLKGFW